MPTIINIQNADSKAQDIYVLQLQIRDATQKLTMPTLGKPFAPCYVRYLHCRFTTLPNGYRCLPTKICGTRYRHYRGSEVPYSNLRYRIAP